MDVARTPTRQIDLVLAQQVDLAASLAPLSRAGDDLIDRWDGEFLLRTMRRRSTDQAVAYVARIDPRPGTTALILDIPADGPADEVDVARQVRATFVLQQPALEALVEIDAAVAQLVERYPGLVPVLFPDPLQALIRSISAQQVNLPWAAVIRARLATRFGRRHPVGESFVYSLDPGPLADAAVAELRALQLTTSKSRAVIDVARAAQAGELNPDQLAGHTDDELIAHLTRLRGIGRWSAEWFLARTLGRPRVVAGDLGVRKAVARLYHLPGLPSEPEARRLTEHWGAAATLAQALALHDLALAAVGDRPGRV